MTTSQTETQSAVRYERDDDGIVTLTLDDPTASANTMNDLYRESMQAAVARLFESNNQVMDAEEVFALGQELTR